MGLHPKDHGGTAHANYTLHEAREWERDPSPNWVEVVLGFWAEPRDRER